MNKIFSLLISITVTIFFSACGSEDLVNDPNTVLPSSSLSVEIDLLSLNIDSSTEFTVSAKKDDGTADDITVVSSNTDVITVSVVNNVVTAKAISLGSADITIVSDSNNELTIPVLVVEDVQDLSTISLDKLSMRVEENSTASLIVLATTDGVTSDTITATSSNTDIFTLDIVDNNITITSHSAGDAMLTVTSGSDKNITCAISIYKVGVATLSLDQTSVSMNVNSTEQITATATVDGINKDSIVASSSDTNIATVLVADNNITITSSSIGDAVITVTSDSNVSKTFNVSVVAISVEDNTVVIGDNYLEQSIIDDKGILYTLNAEYGKTYEISIKDRGSQSGVDFYTLDTVTSVYNEDFSRVYKNKVDHIYTTPELITPVESERLYIHIQPAVSGVVGDFSMKVQEINSLHEGSKEIHYLLEDGLIKSSKVSNVVYENDWSYYSTNIVSSTTKTILIDNISPAEDLALKVYEDEGCTLEVDSATSASTGSVSLTHTYSKSGTFCIGVQNISLLDSPTYDISVYGNKAESGTRYKSTNVVDIPDNNVNGAESLIKVVYGIIDVSSIKVDLNITHLYDNDLSIYLTSPSGIESVLSMGNGGSGDNYINTIFDDNASISINDTNASAPFTGSFIPESPLSIFTGENPNGIWTLKVIDGISGDSGRIESWAITIE